jgi:steroid delta-isomerase-like uncharacterized protein
LRYRPGNRADGADRGIIMKLAMRWALLPVLLILSMSAARAQDGAVEVVQAYMAAWNQNDAAAAAAFLTEDVTYFDASVGTPLTGRDAARVQIIESFLNAVPDARWEPNGTTLTAYGSVAMEWTFSGTNTGAWSDGTPATGKSFSFRGMSMFQVVDRHIRAQADYYDALGFYKQLGLM